MLLGRNNFKKVSDSQLMYVLKVIRIFISLLGIYYIYPNIQERVKAKNKYMKKLG